GGSGRREGGGLRDRRDGGTAGGDPAPPATRRAGGDREVKPRSSIAPIPPGALDLAGDAVRRRRQLQSRMLERLEAAGYQEIIPLALGLARCADVTEFQVNVGHVGALAQALAPLAPQDRAVVRRLIDRKDAAGLATAAPGVLAELPFIIGRREALDRAAQLVGDVAHPNEGVTRLHAVDAALTDDE